MKFPSEYNLKKDVYLDEKLLLFNIDISKFSKSLQFVICVGGVFFFYLLYGYFQVCIHCCKKSLPVIFVNTKISIPFFCVYKATIEFFH